jgi:hypothetical protein
VTGFVVCASCGTQIKAGRAYCLHCLELLPVEGAPVKTSVWESLQLSHNKLLTLLAVVALVVLILVLVIWQTQPLPLDDVAKPVNLPAAPAREPPPPAAENAAPAESLVPAPNARLTWLASARTPATTSWVSLGSCAIDSSRYS